MSAEKKFKIHLIAITIIGFILRLAWIISVNSVPVSDFAAYQDIAKSVFSNEPSKFLGFQGPGYPLALGMFYKLTGTANVFYGKIFNLILSVLTMLVLLKVFILLFDNKMHIYICYFIVAFIPSYIAYNNILATEPLCLFLFSIIVLLQLAKLNDKLKWIFLGLVTGLCSLVKPYMVAFPVIIAATSWFKDKDIIKTIKMLITVQFICLSVIAPWTYRNYKTHSDFILISYNNGYVMYLNNNDQANGVWMPITDIKMTDETIKAIKDSGYTYEQAVSHFYPELNKVFKDEAVRWIKQNPAKFSSLALKRLKATYFAGCDDVFTWAMNGDNGKSIFYLLVSSPIYRLLANAIVITLGVLGIGFTLYHSYHMLKAVFDKSKIVDYQVSIPVLNILFTSALSIVYEGQPRYEFNLLFIFGICVCMINLSLYRSRKVVANI